MRNVFLQLPLSGMLIVQKNNLKVFRSKKAKGTKQDSQNQLRSARPEGDKPSFNNTVKPALVINSITQQFVLCF
jgi:hypothetical protein